ncbi:segregation and condensation protein B [Mycobacterium xenopi 3993]|nr:segregation and condensation protein B [Mycobacterium xenopi 3993]
MTVETLAAVTEQPVYRVAAKLRLMADELAERDSGIDLREAGGDGACIRVPGSRLMSSGCCSMGHGQN